MTLPRIRDHLFAVAWAIPFALYISYLADYRQPTTVSFRVLTPEVAAGELLIIGTMTEQHRVGCDVESTIWRVNNASEVRVPVESLGVTPRADLAPGEAVGRRVTVPIPPGIGPGRAFLRYEREAKCLFNPLQQIWPIQYEDMIVPFVVLPKDEAPADGDR